MNTQKVSLKIQYTTSFGENLFVSGTYWDDWKAQVPLTWHEGGNWEYVFDADLGAGAALAIEYKYLVRNDTTGATRWETTGNRQLTVRREATGKSLLVSDAWEHLESTRVRPGLTREEEAVEARRQRAEEEEARREGLDFFKKSLQNSKRESENRRRKEEEELIKKQNQRMARDNEELQRKEKILSSRHATLSSATATPSASSLTASGGSGSSGSSLSVGSASESIVINPAMQTDMIYNGTTSPIMPFMPRYSSSPRDFSPMNRGIQNVKNAKAAQEYRTGLKAQQQQQHTTTTTTTTNYVEDDVDDDVVDDEQ